MPLEFNIKNFETACGVSIINFLRFISKCMGSDLGLDRTYELSQVINLGSINLDKFYCNSSHLFAIPVSIYWWVATKKKKLNLDIRNTFARSHTEHRWRCSLHVKEN